jgi:hypothetical protein
MTASTSMYAPRPNCGRLSLYTRIDMSRSFDASPTPSLAGLEYTAGG